MGTLIHFQKNTKKNNLESNQDYYSNWSKFRNLKTKQQLHVIRYLHFRKLIKKFENTLTLINYDLGR